MLVVGFAYMAWIFWSPINFLFGFVPGTTFNEAALVVNTILFAPIIYFLIRKWLRTMTKRKGGPAAGIDTVEPGVGVPEPGDEWGTATQPYSAKKETRVIGPKSEIRESPIGLDDGFFVKLPDLDTGEEIFNMSELHGKAMKRAVVTSGGWIHKAASSRSMGSLKTSDSPQQGRSVRSRIPAENIRSIHISATVMAAVTRLGRLRKSGRVKIIQDDLRENVFTARVPLTMILVIDVSMSMKGSMQEVRSVLEQIERETRGSRDRVGIIAFKDSGAIEVQAPTTNWNKIYRAMAKLRISGLTPLAEALMKGLETIRRERMRNPSIDPLIVLISDFSPNIPLAQSVGPGHARYTPVRDLVKAGRLIRKNKVRLAAIDVNREHAKWAKILKRPYHDALGLAATLRMKKDGLFDPIEAVLSVHEFRQAFGAFLVARSSGGRAFLPKELQRERSVVGALLAGSHTKSKLRVSDLKDAEAYLAQ